MAFDGDILDDLRQLQNTLNLYGFGNDGRAIFRELLQNADDAGATNVQFHVLDQDRKDDKSATNMSDMDGDESFVVIKGNTKIRNRDALVLGIKRVKRNPKTGKIETEIVTKKDEVVAL